MKAHNSSIKSRLRVAGYAGLFGICVISGIILMRTINHVNPVKETSEDSAVRIYKICKNNSQAERCYAERFSDLVKKRDISHALATLQNVQSTDPEAKSCHFIAHKISQSEVEKDPGDWLSVFGKVNLSACSRGFFHGAIEGHLQADPEFVLNKESITDICSSITNNAQTKLSPSRANTLCVHAIGHILLVQTEGIIDKSIDICSRVRKDQEYDCYDGVFMENANRENLLLHGIAEDLNWDYAGVQQIENTCNKYSGLAGKACWSSLSEMMGSVADGDSKKLYGLCQSAIDLENRKSCYVKGAGFMAFLLVTGRNNPNPNLSNLCNSPLVSEALVDSCIQYVASYLLNTSPSYAEKLLPFCGNIGIGHAAYCYRETAAILRSLAPLEKVKWCNRVPLGYKNVCT